MRRALLKGLIGGMLVSGVVLVGLSLSLPLPDRPAAPPIVRDAQDPAAPSVAPAPVVGGQAAPPPAPSPAPAPEPVPEAVPEPAPEPVLEPAPEPALMPQAAPKPEPVPGPGPAVALGDRLAPLPMPVAVPTLPLLEVAPNALSVPEPLAPAPIEDPAPGAAAPAPLPAATLARPPDKPAPGAVPLMGLPQLATIADAGAAVSAPSRVMAQEREDQPNLIGAAPAPLPPPMPAPALDPVDAPAVAPVAPLPDGPAGALGANAVDFDDPLDRPLMSVVLIEDAARPLDPAMLSRIGFPVSVALDPAGPGAAARAAALRAAGFEVVILATDAIRAAAPSRDGGGALADAQAIVPQAVALIEHPAAPLKAEPATLSAILDMLADTGHGLIVLARDQDTAATAARQAGVVAATAFRVLDSDDQRAPLISRYLDRATFAAAQEGAVIVVGRTRPETIAALSAWSPGARAAEVRLAPVSAALLRLNR